LPSAGVAAPQAAVTLAVPRAYLPFPVSCRPPQLTRRLANPFCEIPTKKEIKKTQKQIEKEKKKEKLYSLRKTEKTKEK